MFIYKKQNERGIFEIIDLLWNLFQIKIYLCKKDVS